MRFGKLERSEVSRIGKKPIEIPENVTVKARNGRIFISGPKGELTWGLPKQVKVEIGENKLVLSQEGKMKKARASYGTTRQQLANMIKGVTEGWSKTLEIVGTGYRANLVGGKLVLSLGFSHPLEVAPPEGITFEVQEGKIKIFGIDKTQVGQVAANLRALHPPDSYKGKGIRYSGEKVKLKPGKAVAKIGVPGIGGK